ncbi:zinc finger protein 184-like isoform X3 [Eurosta solidaginis]|uniref:zinc finger protein 184-like isoform X3 n=1 Tax=Eurosta solidaginis TaxID=178769 RepID=UPI003530C0AB
MDTNDLYIDYLCRTCMIKLEAFTSEGSAEPQHQSIFETIEECDELRIADLLSSTIPQIVEVQLSDDLPKKICCKCLHQLISAYRFQKLCVQSEHKMREMVSKKRDDLNMSMVEAAIEDEVLPNDTDSYPLSSCQPKCTAQNSLLRETETALEGRQRAIESESAQWSTAEHLLKNEQLLDYCENSQDELSEFIKNEPIEYDEENTEYNDTILLITFGTKEEITTEEQKVTVPCKENLEDGKQLKLQGNELECDICGKCYRQKGHLKYHKRLHSGEKLHKCDICEMRYINGPEKDEQYQYPCDICGKHFKTKRVLNIHKRDHSGVKSHKCDVCEMRFLRTTNLRDHMRTHTGEKPYKCKYCDRCFTTNPLLHRHLSVHLGDYIHRCESCPLAFRLASELRLHSTTHEDDDPETRERNMAALRDEEAKLKVNR